MTPAVASNPKPTPPDFGSNPSPRLLAGGFRWGCHSRCRPFPWPRGDQPGQILSHPMIQIVCSKILREKANGEGASHRRCPQCPFCSSSVWLLVPHTAYLAIFSFNSVYYSTSFEHIFYFNFPYELECFLLLLLFWGVFLFLCFLFVFCQQPQCLNSALDWLHGPQSHSLLSSLLVTW